MDIKENNTLESQQQNNEECAIQRNKELFEYEMTEVKLMLAGRFKHVTASDMQNAGADVVVRETNLHLKEYDLFPDGKVNLNQTTIPSVDLPQFSISHPEKVEIIFSDVVVKEAKKVTRAKCEVSDVEVNLSGNAVKEPKISYKQAEIEVGVESVGLPKTADLDFSQKKIELSVTPVLNETDRNNKLTYENTDTVVEVVATEIGTMKNVNAIIPRMETAISVQSVNKLRTLHINQTQVDIEKPAVDHIISAKELRNAKVSADELEVEDIKLGAQKKLELRQITTEQVESEKIVVPVGRRLSHIHNNKGYSPVVRIDRLDDTTNTPKLIPTEYIVTCDIELPSAERGLKSIHSAGHTVECSIALPERKGLSYRGDTSREQVTVSASSMSVKKFPEQQHSMVSLADDTDPISFPKLKKIQTEVPNCDKISIDTAEISEVTSSKYEVELLCDHIDIQSEYIAVPQSVNVQAYSVNIEPVSVAPGVIPTHKRELTAAVTHPEIDAEKMKVSPLSSIEEIIEKVESISNSVLPHGMTYEEMCRRCVVPVRKLDYKPVFDDIISTIKAELNS